MRMKTSIKLHFFHFIHFLRSRLQIDTWIYLYPLASISDKLKRNHCFQTVVIDWGVGTFWKVPGQKPERCLHNKCAWYFKTPHSSNKVKNCTIWRNKKTESGLGQHNMWHAQKLIFDCHNLVSFLPEGHVTDGNLWNASSFCHVSFVVRCYPDLHIPEKMGLFDGCRYWCWAFSNSSV